MTARPAPLEVGGLGKAKSEGKAPSAPPTRARQVALTAEELHQTRELLESVMTIAGHGILYRLGQMLGARVVADSKARGGSLTDAACALLVERGWATEVRFFAQKAQVKGSVEAKPAPEPTCHMMRGLLHAVAAAGGGPVNVREESCAAQGADLCTFAFSRGSRLP